MNEELIKRLRDLSFNSDQRRAYLEVNRAANALENFNKNIHSEFNACMFRESCQAADKRIAELEAQLELRQKEVDRLCDRLSECQKDAERKNGKT